MSITFYISLREYRKYDYTEIYKKAIPLFDIITNKIVFFKKKYLNN